MGNHFFKRSGLKNACHRLRNVSLGLGFHDVLEQLINHTVQLKGRCCLAKCTTDSLLGQITTKCANVGAHSRLLKLRLDHMLSPYTSHATLVLGKLEKLLHKDLVSLRCLLLLEAPLQLLVLLYFLVEHDRDFINLKDDVLKTYPHFKVVVFLANQVYVAFKDHELRLFLESALLGRLSVLHEPKQ